MAHNRRSELIAIEREVQTPDGMGGIDVTWEQVGRIYAAVKWIGGSETVTEGAIRNESRYKFTVPAAAAAEIVLTPQDRIVWSGVRYNIRETPRRQVGTRMLDIIAESGVAL